ncbi:MAG TPA: exonuclease domain-containing protein [Noviherbaspirillum sp.]
MRRQSKFILALGGLYTLLGGITALIYLAVWADLNASEKQAILRILEDRAGVILLILLVGLLVIGMVFELIFRSYVRAPLKLREKLSVMLNANRTLRMSQEGPVELRALTSAINELADQRDELQRHVVEKIREANASVEEEKNRFAALISELNQSVIVCNVDGRILLYNNRARMLFQSLSGGGQMTSGTTLVGLGRSIFAVLERNLITHALEKIRHRLGSGDSQPVANFVTTTPSGQLIRAQMAPVLNATQQDGNTAQAADGPDKQPVVSGYVLILDNITRHFDVESRRDLMLQSLTEGSRSSLANIRAAVENLHDYPDMDAGQRDRFIAIMRDEVHAMSQRLDRTVTEFADALKVRWPLEEMLGFDLIQAAQRRIEQRLSLPTKTEEIDEGLWIKVDSFSLLQGLTYLAARLKEEYQIREVRFRLTQEGRLAHLDLIWSGVVIGSETLLDWETDAMHAGGENSPLTLREVVERHGGELWFQRDKFSHRSFFRILIPTAAPPEILEAVPSRSDSRPEYYDFDLFRQTEETRALDDRRLTELTYTVFDTETTGLDPSSGDEVIQIGATRIVNGRLLQSEVFDQLIDPKRPIAAESTRIHGITREMLAGQPSIDRVLPRFHAFAEDTVLVGHNAAFDMRFLQMKEAATGIAFRQPVLDTLLLSAVVHPNHESHRLEAIAERLGVNIVGRHTALGDAIVTGEVFLKMIPLLAERGIHTLREAREATERTYYAKIRY